MPETFVPLHAWLQPKPHSEPPIDVTAEPPLPEPSQDEEAFDSLCSALRRFRAALLDALACANDGRPAELRVRCGTIDARIDLDPIHLAESLQ